MNTRTLPPLPEHTFIDDAAGIDALGARMRDAPWVALDTESNSMFVYRERVCLVQVNVAGELYVVDTLAVPATPASLAPWRAALSGPDVGVFLHGGEYDVAVLKRDYDLRVASLYDTQQAASYIGIAKTGYGNLVAALCDVELPKEHSQYDWGRRPIDRAALRYALNDVIYLPELAQRLEEIAAEADLTEEIAIASEAVTRAEPHAADYDPERVWRLKGIHRLDDRQLGVVVALYRWRDEVAQAKDAPPGRIIPNAGLVQLGQRPPRSLRDLKRTRVRRAIVDKHGQALLTTIAEALDDPPALPPRPERPRTPPQVRERASKLADWRRAEAKRRGVPQVVVLPTAAVDHLVHHGADDLASAPELGPKRAARYGGDLRRLLA